MHEMMLPLVNTVATGKSSSKFNKVSTTDDQQNGAVDFITVLNNTDRQARTDKLEKGLRDAKADKTLGKVLPTTKDVKDVVTDSKEDSCEQLAQQIQIVLFGLLGPVEQTISPNLKNVIKQNLLSTLKQMDSKDLASMQSSINGKDYAAVFQLLSKGFLLNNQQNNNLLDQRVLNSDYGFKTMVDKENQSEQKSLVNSQKVLSLSNVSVQPKQDITISITNMQENLNTTMSAKSEFNQNVAINIPSMPEALKQMFARLIGPNENVVKQAVVTTLQENMVMPSISFQKILPSQAVVEQAADPIPKQDSKISQQIPGIVNHVVFKQNLTSGTNDFMNLSQNLVFQGDIRTLHEDIPLQAMSSFQGVLSTVNDNVSLLNSSQVQSDIPQTSDPYQVMDQVIHQIRLNSKANSSEMIIKLQPEHLGEITLKVAVDNGLVSATFQTSNQDVKQVIESSLMQLKQEMVNQGLKISYVGVYAGLSQFGEGQQQQAPYRQSKSKNGSIKEEDFLQNVVEGQRLPSGLASREVDYFI